MKHKPKNKAAIALGRMKSPAKTAAARENGAKGGFWATQAGKDRLETERYAKAARELRKQGLLSPKVT